MHASKLVPGWFYGVLVCSALALGACAADVDSQEGDVLDDAVADGVETVKLALANRAPPGDGTACTVKDLGGGTHTGSSEKNGQWCCTPAGSAPDSNTCYNCTVWSYTCTVKTAFSARF